MDEVRFVTFKKFEGIWSLEYFVSINDAVFIGC